MTLEEYLRKNSYPNTKAIDHVLRVEMTDNGVFFYIHPHGVGGDTENFKVEGNTLSPDPRISKEPHTTGDEPDPRYQHPDGTYKIQQ